jgi:hypothetical protein
VKETGRRRAEKCCAAAEAMAENRDRAGADFRHRVEMAERRIDIGKNLGVGEEIDGDVGALAGWPPVEKIRRGGEAVRRQPRDHAAGKIVDTATMMRDQHAGMRPPGVGERDGDLHRRCVGGQRQFSDHGGLSKRCSI